MNFLALYSWLLLSLSPSSTAPVGSASGHAGCGAHGTAAYARCVREGEEATSGSTSGGGGQDGRGQYSTDPRPIYDGI
jgi:hypothetical protein